MSTRHERLVAQLLLSMPLSKVSEMLAAIDEDIPATFPATMRPAMSELATQLVAALDRDDIPLHEKVAIENLAALVARTPDAVKSLLNSASMGTVARHPAAEVMKFLLVHGIEVLGTPAMQAACAKNPRIRYFVNVYRKETSK